MSAVISKPEISAKPFLIGCGVFLLFIVYMGMNTPRNLSAMYDFRSFYASGYMVRTHPSALYDLDAQKQVQDRLVSPEEFPLPYAHASYEALLYAPFSFLSYRNAYLAFIVFNVSILVAAFFTARSVFSTVIPLLQPRPGLMLLIFAPIVVAVWQGQDSLVFLLLCCWVWRKLEKGETFAAGCILALCLFRFQLALPLALLLSLRFGRRFVTGFLLCASGVVALCAALISREGVASMYHLMFAFSLSGDQSALAQKAMAVHPRAMPNLYGLLSAMGADHLPAHAAFAVSAVLSLAVLAMCAYYVRKEQQNATAFTVAILGAMLVSQHMYLHDASLLALAVALCARRTPEYLLACLYLLPAALFFFVGSQWFFLCAVPMLGLLYFVTRPGAETKEFAVPLSQAPGLL